MVKIPLFQAKILHSWYFTVTPTSSGSREVRRNGCDSISSNKTWQAAHLCQSRN